MSGPASQLPSPGRESGLEVAHEDIELLSRAVDVQNRVFSIRREEQSQSVWPDLDVCAVVSVRARHVDAWKRNGCDWHCFTFSLYGRKTALFASRAFSCDARVSSISFFCRAISRWGASRSSKRMACASAVRARASSRREVT